MIPPPLIIRCRYCHEQIELGPDSQEARAEGSDPRQQMREHVLQHPPDVLIKHARHLGWITDMLFFTCPEQPQRWRENIDRLISQFEQIP
jgi:hypothetical protein